MNKYKIQMNIEIIWISILDSMLKNRWEKNNSFLNIENIKDAINIFNNYMPDYTDIGFWTNNYSWKKFFNNTELFKNYELLHISDSYAPINYGKIPTLKRKFGQIEKFQVYFGCGIHFPGREFSFNYTNLIK